MNCVYSFHSALRIIGIDCFKSVVSQVHTSGKNVVFLNKKHLIERKQAKFCIYFFKNCIFPGLKINTKKKKKGLFSIEIKQSDYILRTTLNS